MIDFDFLPHGVENAVPAADVCKLLGLDNTRVLRQAVRAARLDGIPVCSTRSNGGGYFLPRNLKERLVFVRQMRREAAAINKVADAVMKRSK